MCLVMSCCYQLCMVSKKYMADLQANEMQVRQ